MIKKQLIDNELFIISVLNTKNKYYESINFSKRHNN